MASHQFPETDEFLKRVIDGYLLKDLENMNSIKVAGAGNCGYPMLSTMFGGAELLGGLAYSGESEWDRNKDKEYFEYFFRKYIGEGDQEIIDQLWRSARNRLAHTFLTDAHIVVYKNSQPEAFVNDTVSGLLSVDVSRLYDLFRQGVMDLKNQLDSNIDFKAVFDGRLKKIKQTYSNQILSSSVQFNRSVDVSVSALLTTPSGINMPLASGPSRSFPLATNTTTLPFDDKSFRE